MGEVLEKLKKIDCEPDGLVETDKLDYRSLFTAMLLGKGLEIGPLNRPMCKHQGMIVNYVDCRTASELKSMYPELGDASIVDPDIIDDAETLSTIPSETFDFLISAHVIEHMRNPILALKNWCRCIKPGGLLYLVVPDKRKTFDAHRPRTSTEHLLLDYYRPSAERDYEHFLEMAIYGNNYHYKSAIKLADEKVQRNESIHFHVFLASDITKLLRWFNDYCWGIEILKGPSMNPETDEFHLLLKIKEKVRQFAQT